MAAATVAAGVMIGSAVIGGIGKMRGSRQAESASRRQADLIRQQTAEQARRMERGQERVLGEARAGVFASGLQMSGSSEAYVEDLAAEQARELDWLKRAGQMQARSIEKGASVQRQGDMIGAVGGMGQGIAGGIGML